MRLIDADEILDQLENEVKSRENFAKFNNYYKGIQDGLILAKTKIRKMPTVETVESIRYGKWDNGSYNQRCSVCRYNGKKSWAYCPCCGAKMECDQ